MPSPDDNRPALVLFRNDLRLEDNPALNAARLSGCPLVCVYIYETEGDAAFRRPGSASRWWLHHSLESLSSSIRSKGGSLILRSGRLVSAVESLIAETGACEVHASRRYDPAGLEADTELADALRDGDIPFYRHEGFLLHEPSSVRTSSNRFYRVFSPFARKVIPLVQDARPETCDLPFHFASPPESDKLGDYAFLPSEPDWASGFSPQWQPGEEGAQTTLQHFLSNGLSDYTVGRDHPGKYGTSRLSAHLAFGEISPRQVWHGVETAAPRNPGRGVTTFQRELIFREFAWHLLTNLPQMAWSNIDSRFDRFPWQEDANDPSLIDWQKGLTGYPIVDAGMRELWQTGWMHNRVRMIVASFLTKHLMVHWKRGEEWFYDTLVDADPANNAFNWQWTAGSGADAAPFFRIFAPVTQGRRFDADGRYVRAFVPEIAALPDKFLHAPWEAPDDVLSAANVKLGVDYPRPLVDHAAARQRALDAFKGLKDD
ncbi:cryptochrome/photolyase family protein [Notoacmeibacter ruber]|uniref:Deoxyribodipyrimidine photo-lyase n=1 Tax=Notoacmeibacter ruber TaxID=2670375 RepID=A0A3L7JBB5_9HYPH|nr:deoxyribodipyrimidine photo-lyase [Notoacmeibacter ruber]RLQ88027.1 deoxyribodipyrimidine photo-lyase [Notoacmeibacter ruber]